jgi:AraC family transcriptional regulator
VSEIAIESGFSSFSTFSRAFKSFYNESPSEYRNRRFSKNGKITRNIGKDLPHPLLYDHISDVHSQKQVRRGVIHMQVDVKVFPEFHVAYIRHSGYEKRVHNQALTDAFERVSSWVGLNNHYSPDMKVMAVIQDHPDFTQLEKRRYDAAFTVHKNVITGAGEISIQDIPSGKYAVTRVSTNNLSPDSFGEAIANVWKAFDYLHDTWLEGGGFLLDNRPYLEIYETSPSDPILIIDVCIPVKDK